MQVDLELPCALAAVKVNHAGRCIGQEVAVGWREGSAPSFPALTAESTIPGFAPPRVQVTETGASPVEGCQGGEGAGGCGMLQETEGTGTVYPGK